MSNMVLYENFIFNNGRLKNTDQMLFHKESPNKFSKAQIINAPVLWFLSHENNKVIMQSKKRKKTWLFGNYKNTNF